MVPHVAAGRRRQAPAAFAILAGVLAADATSIAAAQSGTLEASYIVLGGEGPVARAILSGSDECPAITFGAAAQPMRVRATPEAGAERRRGTPAAAPS